MCPQPDPTAILSFCLPSCPERKSPVRLQQGRTMAPMVANSYHPFGGYGGCVQSSLILIRLTTNADLPTNLLREHLHNPHTRATIGASNYCRIGTWWQC